MVKLCEITLLLLIFENSQNTIRIHKMQIADVDVSSAGNTVPPAISEKWIKR